MLMIIYTFLAMAVTPIVYEFANRRMTASGGFANRIKGWPAYIVNVIVCGAMALIAIVLPGGWGVDLWNWIILTALIYFGNQFVFNSVVKPLFKSRTGEV